MDTQQYTWDILIVEDDRDSYALVSDALHHYWGHYDAVQIQVSNAEDGRSCLKMLEQKRPALVIMDLALPQLDGWEALKAIRQNPETADLIVVAMTGYHSTRVAENALAAGFDAFYSKPVKFSTFCLELADLIQVQ